jgi:hypothetical protein
MVKLASVRETRMYGPLRIRDQCEDANAGLYLVATLLLLVGSVLLLPGYHLVTVGLYLVLVALILIVVVNLHDLYAQLAGFDFRLPLVTLDPQLALIEIAAPLVQALGGILYFMGTLLLLRVGRGAFDSDDVKTVTNHAYRLLIAGPLLWLLGSIHNAFQVYEKVDTKVQLLQKTVAIPFLIASTLFVISGILAAENWPSPAAAIKIQRTAAALAITASTLLVVGAIMNAIRIAGMQEIDRRGGSLEPLRGGAQEKLDHEREQKETLLDKQKYAAPVDIEEGSSYKSAVVTAEGPNEES